MPHFLLRHRLHPSLWIGVSCHEFCNLLSHFTRYLSSCSIPDMDSIKFTHTPAVSEEADWPEIFLWFLFRPSGQLARAICSRVAVKWFLSRFNGASSLVVLVGELESLHGAKKKRPRFPPSTFFICCTALKNDAGIRLVIYRQRTVSSLMAWGKKEALYPPWRKQREDGCFWNIRPEEESKKKETNHTASPRHKSGAAHGDQITSSLFFQIFRQDRKAKKNIDWENDETRKVLVVVVAVPFGDPRPIRWTTGKNKIKNLLPFFFFYF